MQVTSQNDIPIPSTDIILAVSWFLHDNESYFLGRLIRSPGVPKERGVWNSQGGRKDKLFSLYIP